MMWIGLIGEILRMVGGGGGGLGLREERWSGLEVTRGRGIGLLMICGRETGSGIDCEIGHGKEIVRYVETGPVMGRGLRTIGEMIMVGIGTINGDMAIVAVRVVDEDGTREDIERSARRLIGNFRERFVCCD